MAQYMTEKEILTSFRGCGQGCTGNRICHAPRLMASSFDLANGVNVLVGTARGDLKNYTLPACAELVHSIGIDRFTVGLHGYTQK